MSAWHAIARDTGTPPARLDAYAAVLDDLVQSQFLARADADEGAEIIRALFGGTASSYAEATGTARPVAFFADTRLCRRRRALRSGQRPICRWT